MYSATVDLYQHPTGKTYHVFTISTSASGEATQSIIIKRYGKGDTVGQLKAQVTSGLSDAMNLRAAAHRERTKKGYEKKMTAEAVKSDLHDIWNELYDQIAGKELDSKVLNPWETGRAKLTGILQSNHFPTGLHKSDPAPIPEPEPVEEVDRGDSWGAW